MKRRVLEEVEEEERGSGLVSFSSLDSAKMGLLSSIRPYTTVSVLLCGSLRSPRLSSFPLLDFITSNGSRSALTKEEAEVARTCTRTPNAGWKAVGAALLAVRLFAFPLRVASSADSSFLVAVGVALQTLRLLDHHQKERIL